MNRTSQYAFVAGELSPHLYGRIDLDRYKMGLRLCQNMTVLPEGGVRRRAGFRFLGALKHANKRARLIPFVFNNTQTYVLEFGDYYIRFWKNGVQILDSVTGNPLEVASTYMESELADINFVQSADVMTLVHPMHKPAELRRYSDTSWTLSDITFAPTISAPAAPTVTPEDTTTLTPQRQYKYKITAINNSTGEESLPSPSTQSALCVLASDTANTQKRNINVSWGSVSGATHYGVYRDDGSGVFSFVGEAEGQTSFRDNNYAPIETENPPAAVTYFQSATNYPGCVTYFEQRLVFGASELEPQTIWMSQSGMLKNFSAARNPRDNDSCKFTLASRKVNTIRQLVPLGKLLALTEGAEWALSGSEGPITPSDISAKCQSERGCANIPPIVIGNAVLYVTSNRRIVRDLVFRMETEAYDGNNMCIMSKHLFKNRTISEMAHAAEPDSVVWVVMSDGALLSFTYEREHEVWAWARHNTAGDYFESVCVVNENGTDRLYASVCRAIGGAFVRYLEKLELSEQTDQRDAFFVDSGKSFDLRNPPGVITVTGSEWTQNSVVNIDISGAEWANQNRGQCVVFNGSDGRRYLIEITAVPASYRAYGKLLQDLPDEFQNTTTSEWDLSTKNIFGLEHLEGRTVSVLCDGNVHPQLVVSLGKVELQEHSTVTQVGLPIDARIETLSLHTAEGPGKGVFKNVKRVFVELNESRGVWVGEPGGILREAPPVQRRVYDGVREYQLSAEVTLQSTWNTGGRIIVAQIDPLPMHILSIEPEVEFGR